MPRLVAAVLSGRLQREVSVTDCGFVDCAPAGDDPYDGLRCSGTLEGTVRTVFLTEQIAHLSKLGGQYGSGRVREQMVALLHREANQLLHGSYTEKTGRALLSTVARATYTTGWMSGDVGRYSLAQRYHIQALDLAMRAGDRPFGANILQEAGRLTVRLGENAPPGQDTSRHGRQAVTLARAGLSIAQDTATPALAAKLHAVQARGFALLGDGREARHAVLAAQRAYESVNP